VERTLLSAAFYLDLDFCLSTHGPVQSRGRAALQRPRQAHKLENPASAAKLRPTRCLPERSMRIRLMNPHAQSKDPCTLIRVPAASGSPLRARSSEEERPGRARVHSCRIHAKQLTRLQPLGVSAPKILCHPEARSLRRRIPALSSAPEPPQGVLPVPPGRESHRRNPSGTRPWNPTLQRTKGGASGKVLCRDRRVPSFTVVNE